MCIRDSVVAPRHLDHLRVLAVEADDALAPHEVGHVVEDVAVHLNLFLEGVRRLQELSHVLVLRLRLHNQVVLAQLGAFLLQFRSFCFSREFEFVRNI